VTYRPTAAARKTWMAIAIAVPLIVVMAMVALVGGGIYFASRHISRTSMSPEAASAELDRLAARFANQRPLVHLRNDSLVVDHVPGRLRKDITSLHVLAYDMRAGKLVNMTVSGWLLRRLGGGESTMTVNGVDIFGGPNGGVTMKDIERHGPGLILDGRDRDGERVLAWTE
jgi:hypothetical protein